MRRATTLLSFHDICLWCDVPIEATYSPKESLCLCIASLILSPELRSSLSGERSFLLLLYNVSTPHRHRQATKSPYLTAKQRPRYHHEDLLHRCMSYSAFKKETSTNDNHASRSCETTANPRSNSAANETSAPSRDSHVTATMNL